MSSFRQIDANRRNARLSTGPVTEDGKRKSLQNALRHGLTAPFFQNWSGNRRTGACWQARDQLHVLIMSPSSRCSNAAIGPYPELCSTVC
jgi:hypothetical protein